MYVATFRLLKPQGLEDDCACSKIEAKFRTFHPLKFRRDGENSVLFSAISYRNRDGKNLAILEKKFFLGF